MIPVHRIPLKWLPWFHEVFRHPAKHKRVSGGRDIWKTTHAVDYLWLKTLSSPRPGVGLYTAETNREVKRILWDRLNERLESFPVKIKTGQNANDLTIQLIHGYSLLLMGMDKYDSLRGIHPVVNVNDEIAKVRPEGFQAVMGPALLSHAADTLDITSPRRGWWHKRWLEGWEENRRENPDTMSWKIRTQDAVDLNGRMVVPWDLLMKEKRRMPPSLYAQEYEGEFSDAAGPIWAEFVRQPYPRGHLVNAAMARKQMDEGGYMIGAIDWGFSGKAVLQWIWVTRTGGVIFLDELVVSNRTPQQMMQMARGQADKKYRLPKVIALDAQCWARGDMGISTAERFMLAGQRDGVRFVQADKRFRPSIEKMRDLMVLDEKDTFPSFAVVGENCPNLQEQLADLLETDVKASGAGFVDGVEADSGDCARYGTMLAAPRAKVEIDTRPRGPLLARRDIMRSGSEEIVSFDPMTGIPRWSADA